MPAHLSLHATPSEVATSDTLLLVGRASRLLAPETLALVPVDEAVWRDMIRKNDPGDHGRVVTTWRSGSPSKVVAGILPEPCSRHNAPSRSWAIPALVQGAGLKGNVGIVLCLDDAAHLHASALAVARAHPTYSATSGRIERDARLAALGPDGPLDTTPLKPAVNGVRFAADLVDQPPSELNVSAFVEAARQVAARLPSVSLHVLRGEQLREQGLGGLYGVGRAAEDPPALVVLDHDPGSGGPKHAWVGKGIVYDTGGLSIKTKTGMPGMKTDMGGAAAVLAAFAAAVELGLPERLTAVLCLAENAVGPKATRPDDVLHMYSGKTVEVNNTDAEGRLVLADGVAWVVKHREPDLLVDMATLTGAQAMATGKKHGALYCSDEALEQLAVRAGRASGDMVHPLPYLPELLRKEFQSAVADMRNSVKDRSNAQSSCAGQFIGNHLAAVGYDKPWLHVDMAAPAVHGGRGTGFGVGLLLALAGVGASPGA